MVNGTEATVARPGLSARDAQELRQKIKEARLRTLELCVKAGHGHISSAFSCAEICGVLYYRIMRYRVNEPDWEERDRIIMSKNHASVMLFPIMNDVGIITDEEYQTIMCEGSRRTHHTDISLPGMDFSGGALGIGLGMAAGSALAAQIDKKSYITFCILGDAECCEGSIWESVMFAGHNHLNNLVAIIDHNNMGVSDHTSNMINMEPVEDKWRSFGWETRRINGHDVRALYDALSDVRDRQCEKPLVIVADTIKGKGVRFIEDQLQWHGRVPRGDEVENAFSQLEEE